MGWTGRIAGAVLAASFVPGIAAAAASETRAVDEPSVEEVIYVVGTRDRYRELDTTFVTRTPTPIEKIPQSVVVVTRDVIEDLALTGLTELVRYVPGVTMAQGEGHRDAPVFRGNLTTADFFVNGVRDDLQYLRDLYNVERVDVIQGPSALTLGRGNGGGALNRVTKVADGRDIRAFEMMLGTFGQARFAGDLGFAVTDTLSMRLNTVFEDGKNFRDESDIRRRGIAPAARINLGDVTRIEFFGEYFKDERVVDRGVPSQAGRPWRGSREQFFGNPALSNSLIDVATLRTEITHAIDESISFRGVLSYGDYFKFYENVFAGGAIAAESQSVTIASYNARTERENLLAQADLIWKPYFAGLNHTLLIGLETGRQQNLNLRVNTASKIFSLADRGRTFAPDFAIAPALDNTNDLRLLAVLAQNQLELIPQLSLVVGARWDRFDLGFDDRRPSSRDLTRRDEFVSPRAGLIWEAATGVNLYAGWSIAHLPQAGEQFSSLTPTLASLEPEKFENVEIGLRWQPNDELLLSASLYQLDRTRSSAPGPTPGTLVLTGSQRSEGLELSMQGELGPRWKLIGSLAVQEARITSTTSAAPAGRRAPLVPKFSGSLWSRIALFDRLDIGLGVVRQDSQYASISNAVVLPGYTRIDVALFHRLTEQCDLQVNLENLTDERYWFTAHNDNNLSPGAPRTARMSVSMRF